MDSFNHAAEAFYAVTPLEIMKFTLIYDGDLPATTGKRALYASKIRSVLHDQMRDLWDSHVVMRQLARTARVHEHETHVMSAGVSQQTLPNYDWPIPAVPPGFVDLCAPMPVKGSDWTFLPIVRDSLNLACSIDILFLRHEEPLHLFQAGGDLDNRIKCFFDGLTMPKPEQLEAGEEPTANPLCCLLENDRLISDFSIRTGRLLGAGEKRRSAVRIQAEVRIKVLRVMEENLCLVGD